MSTQARPTRHPLPPTPTHPCPPTPCTDAEYDTVGGGGPGATDSALESNEMGCGIWECTVNTWTHTPITNVCWPVGHMTHRPGPSTPTHTQPDPPCPAPSHPLTHYRASTPNTVHPLAPSQTKTVPYTHTETVTVAETDTAGSSCPTQVHSPLLYPSQLPHPAHHPCLLQGTHSTPTCNNKIIADSTGETQHPVLPSPSRQC